MSAEGSRRNRGITSTTAQRTAGISAACYDELPQHEPSAAAEIGANQSTKALRAAKAENSAHRKAPFRALLASVLPMIPPMRDGLSSLNCVSFSDSRTYRPKLREGLINVSQTLAILPEVALRSWHRSAAQRRASAVAKAQSERGLSRSRERARLSHGQLEASDRWDLARDNGPTRRTADLSCLILGGAPTHRYSPKPSTKAERLARVACARLTPHDAVSRRDWTVMRD